MAGAPFLIPLDLGGSAFCATARRGAILSSRHERLQRSRVRPARANVPLQWSAMRLAAGQLRFAPSGLSHFEDRVGASVAIMSLVSAQSCREDAAGTERKRGLPHSRCRQFHAEGVVTSLKEEHENSASRIFSNDRDCLAPHVHSRRAKGSVRPCRSEMTLDVESVVGGCVS